MLDLSVVIPVRNAEHMIDECLASIIRAQPREIIVVDGMSTDRTVEIARRYPVRILSDKGRGVAAARMIGARTAKCRQIALIDVDIVLPEGSLESLLEEYTAGRYTALQAGLVSVAGCGYWGQALVDHHRSGRSKEWPGVMATIIDTEVLLEHGFDERFISGEDIELRWRLQWAGARLGVSKRTIVTHRYDDTFEFAKGQWLADGRGLGRMVHKYGWRASMLLGLPCAAGTRGILLSLVRWRPVWLPYYICYIVYNYIGMLGAASERWHSNLSPGTRRTEHEVV